MKILSILIGFCSFCLSLSAYSQGCSDAGFCSMGAMRANQTINNVKSKVEIVTLEASYSFAESIKGNYVHQSHIEAWLNIHKKNRVQIRLPYSYVQGTLANTQGIGDLSISWSRALYSQGWRSLYFTLGTKLPTGNSNLRAENQLVLPTYYQTGLGTLDLIAGMAWQTKSSLIALAYQTPILHHSPNEFSSTLWKATEGQAESTIYPNSYRIRRGADLMLRLEQNFRFYRFNYFVGVLSVYRLQPDKIYDLEKQEEVEVRGSEGISINWQTGIAYQFSYHLTVKALLSRQKYRERVGGIGKTVIPDGLHREWLVGTSVIYRF